VVSENTSTPRNSGASGQCCDERVFSLAAASEAERLRRCDRDVRQSYVHSTPCINNREARY